MWRQLWFLTRWRQDDESSFWRRCGNRCSRKLSVRQYLFKPRRSELGFDVLLIKLIRGTALDHEGSDPLQWRVRTADADWDVLQLNPIRSLNEIRGEISSEGPHELGH